MAQGFAHRFHTRLRRVVLTATTLGLLGLSGWASAASSPKAIVSGADELPGLSSEPIVNDSPFADSALSTVVGDADDTFNVAEHSEAVGDILSQLQAPLSDYRVTSEFGWRNQPLVKVKVRYTVKTKKAKKGAKGKQGAKAKKVKYRYIYARPKRPIEQFHKGVDMAAPQGTSVHAALDGTIETLGRKGGYGNYVLIRHSNGVETAYAHLARIPDDLEVGQSVSAGDIVGYVGSTGRSTGPHVHYEVRVNGEPIDPQVSPL